MAVLDEVRISFVGDTTQLDRDAATARTKLEEQAKKPIVVAPVADPGPTISLYKNNSEIAKRSLQEIADEKRRNDELDALVSKNATERLRAATRQQAAETFAANERRLQELSKQKHAEYLLDKEAEEKITGTIETEGTKRINRLRGLGALFRAAGLEQYGVGEYTVNAGIGVYNTIQASADARKASAVSAAATATAETETAAAATAAATSETEFAAASGVAAAGTAATATAVDATAVGAAAITLEFTAIAAALLPVVAAAAIFAYWTKTVREESEKQLALEEARAAAQNRQIAYQKGLTDDLTKQRTEAQSSREVDEFKAGLEKDSLDRLKERKKNLEDVNRLESPTQYNYQTRRFELSDEQQLTHKKQAAELIALDAEIHKRELSNQKEAFTQYSNIAEQTSKIQAQAREDFRKSVEEGLKQVKELTKGWTESFTSLESRAHADNPFVKQMIDNAAAVEKFKEQMRLLPPELQSSGYALLQQANTLAIYKLKLDAVLQAGEFREAASRFRDPTKQEQQAQLNQDLVNFQRTSNSTNPDALRYFQERQRNINLIDQKRIQDNLDRQLSIDRAARTPQEQAEVDARIAASTRSIDPNSIRIDQRRELADLFERQATRAERRQEESLDVQKDLLKLWQEIQRTGIKLAGQVQAEGKNALNIKVTDDLSESKVTKITTGTPEDVRLNYGNEIVGGTNQ
jgi:hypothetical protein